LCVLELERTSLFFSVQVSKSRDLLHTHTQTGCGSQLCLNLWVCFEVEGRDRSSLSVYSGRQRAHLCVCSSPNYFHLSSGTEWVWRVCVGVVIEFSLSCTTNPVRLSQLQLVWHTFDQKCIHAHKHTHTVHTHIS